MDKNLEQNYKEAVEVLKLFRERVMKRSTPEQKLELLRMADRILKKIDPNYQS